MPNMEFVIDQDGKLLASWDWARPAQLKEFLEEKIGPSGITEESWAELSKRSRMAVSYANNDEVPGTQVPKTSLSPLKIEPIVEDGSEKPPISLEAGTLPPKVTPGGLSRLYLIIQPEENSNAYFDNAEASVVLFSAATGINLIKDQVVAGKRRKGQDTFPHALGVMWSQDKSAENMEFISTVKAKMGRGDEPVREWTAKFRVSGGIPSVKGSMDEILPDKLPAKGDLKALQCKAAEKEKMPFSVNASIYHDPANPGQGMIYLFLNVDASSGYVWNNLASAPRVNLKPVSGIELEKNAILAGSRSSEKDTDPRILAFWWKRVPGEKNIALEVTPEVWICNNNEGWCRVFAATYHIKGNF